jgi:hypothetical protein
MVTALAVSALLKLVTGLRIGGRRIRRALRDYALASARREVEAERDLWRRSQWDLEAATKLRKHLARRAKLWIELPARLPRFVEEHPEWRPLLEQMQAQRRAEIAALDDTVRRVFGGWDSHGLTNVR